MSIRIYKSNAAAELLQDPTFLANWASLFNSCPWATVFQSVPVVSTWYSIYRDSFDPVLAVEEGGDGTISGLLTLAEDKHRRTLTVVPHRAEYKAWLAPAANSEPFFLSVMNCLSTEYPDRTLAFEYLPAAMTASWRSGRAFRGLDCELSASRRPLMSIGDGERLRESLRKKSNKSRMNRLRRLGEIAFTKIERAEQLDEIREEVSEWYDFRQGAINNSFPFQTDPQKMAYKRALMRFPKLEHVTVLRVGKTLLAAHLGIQDDKTAFLGVFAHSPFFAEHSPGKLHILLLGLQFAKEGIESLDLTPGGDAWKDRFATSFDEVLLLRVRLSPRRNWPRFLSRNMRSSAGALMRTVGLSPSRVRTFLREVAARGGRLARMTAPTSPVELFVFATPRPVNCEQDCLISRNSLRDLLDYRPATDADQDRSAFLRRALSRFEESWLCYSLRTDGTLQLACWQLPGMPARFAEHVQTKQGADLKPVVLCEFFVHPGTRSETCYAFLMKVMSESRPRNDGGTICVAILDSQMELLQATNRLGPSKRISLQCEESFVPLSQD